MESFEVEIVPIEKGRRKRAIDLIHDVFMKYEAPDYSSEGIELFQKTSIHNQGFLDKLEMYGAYQGKHLIGVIATRSNGSHIALFFVNGKYHRQGIGRKLFQVVVENCAATEITVNSSPFAVDVYHHLGFVDTDYEMNVNGLRFTPMKFTKFDEKNLEPKKTNLKADLSIEDK